MWANAEIGSIMPIREIGKAIKKINNKRMKAWNQSRPEQRGGKPRPIYFHTDATQALNFIRCDVAWNYVDMLSLSGHKIYGPKGVGALYKKTGVPLAAVQRGGHHENSLRSGTLNVPGIVGLGAAIEQLDDEAMEKNNRQIAKLRAELVGGILKNIPDTVLNTDILHGTPAHANFLFPGVEGESILISLDMEGVAVSTGSACASGSLEPSHVLLAMGIKPEIAHSSIRFSLGKYNTMEEIRRVIKVLSPIIARLRKMAPKL
jgi:cysteine desulfurase